MREVEDMTLREYLFRMKAHALSRVDEEYDMHLQAWLNVKANLTEQKGKKTVPKFKTFKEFFDYDERIKDITGDKKTNMTDQQRNLARIAKEINQKGGRLNGRNV